MRFQRPAIDPYRPDCTTTMEATLEASKTVKRNWLLCVLLDVLLLSQKHNAALKSSITLEHCTTMILIATRADNSM